MLEFSKVFLCIFLLGIVDQVQGSSVFVELSTSNGEITNMDMPVWMLPCEVNEGDIFYIERNDGITEIRCGEPPE
jgi:hypothetical protein